jgi:hypothetical protein
VSAKEQLLVQLSKYRGSNAMSAVFEREEAEPRSFTRKLSLHAVLPQQALLAQLEGGLIANPSEPILLLHAWENANRSYAQCGRASRGTLLPEDVQPLQGIEALEIESALQRVRLYAPFDTHGVALFDAKVSKLITPQVTLNVARAASRSPRPGMSAGEIFRVAFEGSRKADPITRQVLGMHPNGGSILFTSFDEDIRLHHPPVYQDVPINKKDDRSAMLQAVCLAIGGGCGFIFAYRVDIGNGITRLIIMNGVHRVYELAKAGFQTVPVAVCDVHPMELPDPIVDFPKQILLDPQFNAPVITDFLNQDVVLELDYFPVLKTVRLNWSFEQYATVLK